MIRIRDDDRTVLLDIAGIDRTGAVFRDVQHGFIDVLDHHQGQRLETLNDLVDVFQDTLHGLVFVHHAVHPYAPHGTTAERRQQQAPQRVSERVSETTLQRLKPELGSVRDCHPASSFLPT